MQKNQALSISCLCLCLCCCSLAAWYLWKKVGLPNAPPVSGKVLPVTWPLSKDQAPWYYLGGKQGSNISVKNGAFVFPIKKGLYGSASGDYFKANPYKAFPSDRVTMSYSVYFPAGFDWVKGGKLPGVCFSSKPQECSTGGEWAAESGSFRVMFREDGAAIGYAYFTGSNGDAAMARQPANVKAVGKVKGGAGIDLWHAKDASDLRLVAGKWNRVSFTIQLNAPRANNGTLSLTVNGRTKTLNTISWRTDADVKFNHIIMVTFFGGGSSDWASHKDTEILFRDISIAT